MTTEIRAPLNVCNSDWFAGAALPIDRGLPVLPGARGNVVLSYSRLSCARDASHRIARYSFERWAQGSLVLSFELAKALMQI